MLRFWPKLDPNSLHDKGAGRGWVQNKRSSEAVMKRVTEVCVNVAIAEVPSPRCPICGGLVGADTQHLQSWE